MNKKIILPKVKSLEVTTRNGLKHKVLDAKDVELSYSGKNKNLKIVVKKN